MAKKKIFSIGNALSQGLEETIKSAQDYSGELRVDVIPIKKIDLDPENPRDFAITIYDIKNGIDNSDPNKTRKQNELNSLQSISNSIKVQGIINPITVYKHGDQYRLISGERRTLASILAGKTDVQAKILDEKPSQLKISLLQWIENIERSDLSLWERLTNIERIVEAYAQTNGIKADAITITELSNLIGCVKSHAMNYKSILNADNELKQLIFKNKIKNLEKAALISEIKSNEIRTQAIHACIGGATLKQLKTILENSQKLVSLKPIERRGRQTVSVNFGSTKNINVAKIIVESLLSNRALSNLNLADTKIDWGNPRTISEVFKKLLNTLEKISS